ncbi:MAG: N-formylglutamate amidohydrolase [Steroidobacteraceae bacterium]
MHSDDLIAADEPAPFRVVREHGQSPFLLICDHAGSRVPRSLDSLGVPALDLQRHIAWDIGAAAVTELLAERLDAFAILQTWSRLVIDCNRPPGSAQSILQLSEATPIPGNVAVSSADVLARERAIFRPYHDRINAELDLRKAQQRRTILIAVHSFTPRFHGQQRPWHAGLLYNRDRRFAGPLLRVLRVLRADPGLVVGDNEPYAVSDDTDYTIPVYGEQRGLPHVGIELRQDLITEAPGQREWAERLAHALLTAAATIAEMQPEDSNRL